MADEITEESIMPEGYIYNTDNQGYHDLWTLQYMSFPKSVRDDAAKRLYENLTPAQRIQLKNYACITVKCHDGHSVEIRPTYAGTTSVGCFSMVGELTSYGYHNVHARTSIGDFLLALKLKFALECRCSGRPEIR